MSEQENATLKLKLKTSNDTAAPGQTQAIKDPMSLRDTATGRLKRIMENQPASALSPNMDGAKTETVRLKVVRTKPSPVAPTTGVVPKIKLATPSASPASVVAMPPADSQVQKPVDSQAHAPADSQGIKVAKPAAAPTLKLNTTPAAAPAPTVKLNASPVAEGQKTAAGSAPTSTIRLTLKKPGVTAAAPAEKKAETAAVPPTPPTPPTAEKPPIPTAAPTIKKPELKKTPIVPPAEIKAPEKSKAPAASENAAVDMETDSPAPVISKAGAIVTMTTTALLIAAVVFDVLLLLRLVM